MFTMLTEVQLAFVIVMTIMAILLAFIVPRYTVGGKVYELSRKQLVAGAILIAKHFLRVTAAVFEAELLPIFGKDRPTFEIPDINDGKPVMKGTMVPFTIDECHLPTGLPEDKQIPVEIPAFSNMEVSCFLKMQQYDLPVII